MAWYLDTSAAAKLVVAETETARLQEWIAAIETPVVSSELLRTELFRAVRRVAPDRATRVREVLDALTLINVTPTVFERAAHIEPVVLRSLDAIHLAAALELGDDLEGLVTYDDRLADAAAILGINSAAPG
ncbi:MAG: type II toxin-antitoxin system VapC family toxin [Actinobacteria bacterium]|nr:type II toxin-antitoxin system VapC family toxin [Actinomycetota bacterium]